MGTATARDGTRLHCEEAGSGTPILFVHEFAGNHRSWEPQLRAFARSYRCIVYGARGYPPSDVPEDPAAYSQDSAVGDAVAVLDHLEIESAHVVGLSMGAFTALHLGLRHAERARSLVLAGCGYGAHPDAREAFRSEAEAIASALEADGSEAFAARYAVGPARVQFQNKDPRGWEEFARQLGEHSIEGSAHTMRGVQRERPSLYDLQDSLAALEVPTLLLVGDEDEGCLEANLMLKRTIPSAALTVLPRTGHTSNLEEPERFNGLVGEFIRTVDAGRWTLRDPRSVSTSLTGMSR
ncbi:MAG TPA: alpha/beta hydrolase [Actinomycetota bacterium]|nr:alpha/beta hydrolase [Actinomycetota bacterium]